MFCVHIWSCVAPNTDAPLFTQRPGNAAFVSLPPLFPGSGSELRFPAAVLELSSSVWFQFYMWFNHTYTELPKTLRVALYIFSDLMSFTILPESIYFNSPLKFFFYLYNISVSIGVRNFILYSLRDLG